MFSVTVCEGTSVKCWVDHPETGGDRVARRAEGDRRPVDPDLPRRPAG